MKSKMTLDKIAEIAGNHVVGSPGHEDTPQIDLNLLTG